MTILVFHVICFLILPLCALSQEDSTLYVDCDIGDDINDGFSQDAALKTLKTLNAKVSSFTGSMILLKSGCVFKDALEIGYVERTANTILEVGMYGNDRKPIIDTSSAVDASQWVSSGGGRYHLDGVTDEVTAVFMGVDRRLKIAHFPDNSEALENYFYLPTDQASETVVPLPDEFMLLTQSQVVDANFVVRSRRWAFHNTRIMSYDEVGKTITIEGGGKFAPYSEGSGFVITNKEWMLDSCTDCFFHDVTQGRLHVQISESIETADLSWVTINHPNAGIKVEASSHISIKNIAVNRNQGYGIHLFYHVQYATIQNCETNNNAIGIAPTGWDEEDVIHVTIDNCVTKNNGKHGIHGGGEHVTISNNVVENTMVNGFLDCHFSGTQVYGTGILFRCYYPDSCIITQNRIVNSGYNGMIAFGNSIIVKKNFVNNSCFVTDDCGGIYTGGSGHVVEDNLFMNSIGNSYGTGSYPDMTNDGPGMGIYFDDETTDQTARNNVVINSRANFQLHNSGNNLVEGNLAIGARYNSFLITEDPILNIKGFSKDNIVRNNIFFAPGTDQNLKIGGQLGNIDFFEELDRNYYFKESFDILFMEGGIWDPDVSGNWHTLKRWRDRTTELGFDWDTNSQKISPDFEFNQFVVVPESGNMISNGNFSENIDGFGEYGSQVTIMNTWDEINRCLKSVVEEPEKVGQVTFIISPSFEIQLGVSYVLEFDMWMKDDTHAFDYAEVRIVCIQNGDSYSNLGLNEKVLLSLDKTAISLNFVGTLDWDEARIDFNSVGKESNVYYYLDNIRLYEASISENDLNDSFEFFYNEDIYNSKSVKLEKDYCDYEGNVVKGEVNLEPLKAVVLIKCFCNHDGVCNNRENANTCPEDGCDPSCGNLACEDGETVRNCAADCFSDEMLAGVVIASLSVGAICVICAAVVVVVIIVCVLKKTKRKKDYYKETEMEVDENN